MKIFLFIALLAVAASAEVKKPQTDTNYLFQKIGECQVSAELQTRYIKALEARIEELEHPPLVK